MDFNTRNQRMNFRAENQRRDFNRDQLTDFRVGIKGWILVLGTKNGF